MEALYYITGYYKITCVECKSKFYVPKNGYYAGSEHCCSTTCAYIWKDKKSTPTDVVE